MKMNRHYGELEASYLFATINQKTREYTAAHPDREIIKLSIGDVTRPLAKCVVQAMHDAADEMGTKEGFHGYGPEQGYGFLKEAIRDYYGARGTRLETDVAVALVGGTLTIRVGADGSLRMTGPARTVYEGVAEV